MEVAGSTPVIRSKPQREPRANKQKAQRTAGEHTLADVAHQARASPSQGEGSGFKSRRPLHTKRRKSGERTKQQVPSPLSLHPNNHTRGTRTTPKNHTQARNPTRAHARNTKPTLPHQHDHTHQHHHTNQTSQHQPFHTNTRSQSTHTPTSRTEKPPPDTPSPTTLQSLPQRQENASHPRPHRQPTSPAAPTPPDALLVTRPTALDATFHATERAHTPTHVLH